VFSYANITDHFAAICYESTLCKLWLFVLRDDDFKFLSEEELPAGYKPGELVF